MLLYFIITLFIVLIFYVTNLLLSKYVNTRANINKFNYKKERYDNYATLNNEHTNQYNKNESDDYILPRVVYGYWDNLDGNDVIQAHLDTWSRNLAPGWKAEIITRKNVHNYVDPDFLQKFKDVGAVRFSDFLRVYLLSKNGGVWMDAGTILIDGTFLEKYREEMIQNRTDILIYEFSAHSKPEQPYLENWFLMSPKGSLFITDLYEEFTKSHDMGYLKYKNEVLAPKISFINSMGDGDSTYHMQHGIIHYLLKKNNNGNNSQNSNNKYNMLIKDADESMFKAQKIHDWNSDKLIKYIIDNDDWSGYYAIKLVNFNRRPIESCKTEFINKLNSL
jgi:hypothetical protein